MAIQFNCPYCTATIQVPDHAAGKKGTCPQCRTKLVVPTPKAGGTPPPVFAPQPNAPPANFPPPQFSPPQFAPPQFAPPQFAPPQFAPPQFPSAMPPPGAFAPQWLAPPPTDAPPFVPQPQMPPPGFAPSPEMSAPMFAPLLPMPVPRAELPVVRKSRKKPGWNNQVVIGLVVGAAVIIGGVLGYQFYFQKPKADPLRGELSATRETGKLEPAMVHREWITLDEDLVDQVLKQMAKVNGVKLSSEYILLRFQGTTEGIRISVTPGQSADLIAVEIRSHKGLAKWYEREATKLADKQLKDVIRAATKFVKQWAEADARGEKQQEYSRFHDELGIAALAKGAGSEMIAVVGGNIHHCVAEQDGTLFFLLPAGTQRFYLQGREHGHGKLVFPGHFKVKVADEPAKKSSQKSPADKKSESADDGDGDSEMRTKAFGRPALNDPSATDESMPPKPQPKKKAESKKDE